MNDEEECPMKALHLLTVTVITVGCTLASQGVLSYSTGETPGHGNSPQRDVIVHETPTTQYGPRPALSDTRAYLRNPYQPSVSVGRHYARLSEDELEALDARRSDAPLGQLRIPRAMIHLATGSDITYHF